MAFFLKYIITPALGVTLVSASVMYYMRKFTNEDDINEVLFFCDLGKTCRAHFTNRESKDTCTLTNCSFYNLSRMLHYLNSAKSSIDVCLYLITVKDLAEEIIKAQRKGVKVRVIADEDMANGSGSQISTIRQNGIRVKHQQKSTTLMHHKFVIIDGKILMTGSLNWTMQALCGNWDNVIVTSQPTIVRSFIEEFDRLWTVL